MEKRPWGEYKVLDTQAKFQVKRITVLPEKRLSLQRHKFRAEHWYIIEGEAKVTLDDREFNVGANDTITVPIQAIHRIENISSTKELIFIEVQTGTYFGEDDIERLSDDFGRLTK